VKNRGSFVNGVNQNFPSQQYIPLTKSPKGTRRELEPKSGGGEPVPDLDSRFGGIEASANVSSENCYQ